MMCMHYMHMINVSHLNVVSCFRNSKGYEIAERLNAKFTHIAPVWLQLQWHAADSKFVVAGQHDIDAGWMQRVAAPQGQVTLGQAYVLQDSKSERHRRLSHPLPRQQV